MTEMPDSRLVPRGTTDVPDHVLARRGTLYGVFVRMALDGCSLSAALEQVELARSTFYDWQRDYPEWVSAVKREALQFATDQVRAHEQQLAMRRLAVQRSLDEIVLDNAESIVRQQVHLAKEAESELARLGAAKNVRSIMVDGFLYQKREGRPEPPEPDEGLPYNPHEVHLTEGSIQLPPGSRVQIEVPDVIDALPVVPGDSDPDDDTRTHP